MPSAASRPRRRPSSQADREGDAARTRAEGGPHMAHRRGCNAWATGGRGGMVDHDVGLPALDSRRGVDVRDLAARGCGLSRPFADPSRRSIANCLYPPVCTVTGAVPIRAIYDGQRSPGRWRGLHASDMARRGGGRSRRGPRTVGGPRDALVCYSPLGPRMVTSMLPPTLMSTRAHSASRSASSWMLMPSTPVLVARSAASAAPCDVVRHS